jgi:hypothetical protein
MRTLTGLLTIALVTVACTAGPSSSARAQPHSRDALEMRATALGHMPPPAGAALVSERYQPAEQSLDFSNGAMYTRVFATNTPAQFAAAVASTAGAASYRVDAAFGKPVIQDSVGLFMFGRDVEGEDMRATLWFEDMDVAGFEHWDHSIDRSVWRFVAILRLEDTPRQPPRTSPSRP